MDTRTGEVRPIRPGEELPPVEDVERIEAETGEVPPAVAVPPSYLPLSPADRLALMFGYRGGKDRLRQGRPGVTTKAERKRRRQVASASRRRNRR